MLVKNIREFDHDLPAYPCPREDGFMKRVYLKRVVLGIAVILFVASPMMAVTRVVLTAFPDEGDQQGERLVYHVSNLIERDTELTLLRDGAESKYQCEGYFNVRLQTGDPTGAGQITMYLIEVLIVRHDAVFGYDIRIDSVLGGPTGGEAVVKSAEHVIGMLKSAIKLVEAWPIHPGDCKQ